MNSATQRQMVDFDGAGSLQQLSNNSRSLTVLFPSNTTVLSTYETRFFPTVLTISKGSLLKLHYLDNYWLKL